MNGLNNSLRTDPSKLLRTTPVNASRILAAQVVKVAAEPLMNTVKYGMFDLVQDGTQAWFKEVTRAGGGDARDTAMIGYWCPFRQGMGAAGFVDVPKLNPLTEFVFTAAMNGCALIVMESPDKKDCFRLTHHQHPGVKDGRETVNKASGITDGRIAFEFGTDQYDNPPTTGSFYACFNFLKFVSGTWKLYSQYTKLVFTHVDNATVSASTLDPSRPVIIRDVPMR